MIHLRLCSVFVPSLSRRRYAGGIIPSDRGNKRILILILILILISTSISTSGRISISFPRLSFFIRHPDEIAVPREPPFFRIFHTEIYWSVRIHGPGIRLLFCPFCKGLKIQPWRVGTFMIQFPCRHHLPPSGKMLVIGVLALITRASVPRIDSIFSY